jgi:hypothetical protein
LNDFLLIDGNDCRHNYNTEIEEIAYSWRALANQEIILRIGPLAKLIEEMQTKKFSY